MQEVKLHPKVLFRGLLGSGFSITNSDIINLSDFGLSGNCGIGLEFSTSNITSYVLDLNYHYRRNKQFGMLGGWQVLFAIRFGNNSN